MVETDPSRSIRFQDGDFFLEPLLECRRASLDLDELLVLLLFFLVGGVGAPAEERCFWLGAVDRFVFLFFLVVVDPDVL